jgi:ribulose 1,5-bisphosphate synthetase/thiazole synthase
MCLSLLRQKYTSVMLLSHEYVLTSQVDGANRMGPTFGAMVRLATTS